MKNIVLALLLLCGISLRAQTDLSSLMLEDTWQQMSVNPALQPQGIVINLPGVYNNLWVTNITFNDLIAQENGQNVLTIDNAIAQMGARNLLRQDLDLETVGIGFHVGKLGLSVGHRLRFDALIDYPKTLPQLIWQGNAQFVGETIGFGPAFDLTAYHEFALGASYAVGDKVKLGGKVKYLSGGANLNTERNDLQLTTSGDVYQLELDADLLVNSAGTLSYAGLRDVSVDFNYGNFDTESLFGGNTGLAFDLGVAVELGKLRLAASAVDLGASITWEENVSNYTLDGTFEFQGLDVARQLFDDEESFGSVIDSLYATYEPRETNVAYTTDIGAKYFFSGDYEISEDITVGLIGFADSYRDVNSAAVALTGSINFSPVLRLGGFYGLRNERADNLGVNAVLSLGPVRILAATDNILSAFRPKDAHVANFRLGLNLAFGREREDVDTSEGMRMY